MQRRAPERWLSGGAFTLIELLVVVAIVMLLAALLLPALNTARDRAKSVTCQSNLRTIGQGMYLYCSDFDGRLPFAWSSPYDTIVYGDPWWPYGGGCPTTFVYPYIRNIKAFACPSFKFLPGIAGPAQPYELVVNNLPVVKNSHYKYNPYLGCIGYGPGSYPAWNVNVNWPVPQWSLSGIANASDKVFLFDGLRPGSPYGSSPQMASQPANFLDSTGDGDRSNPYNYAPPGGYWYSMNMGFWHTRGNNVVFLDGHVQWFPTSSDTTFYDLIDLHWTLPK